VLACKPYPLASPLRAYWEGMHLEGRDGTSSRGTLAYPSPLSLDPKYGERGGKPQPLGIRGGKKKIRGNWLLIFFYYYLFIIIKKKIT
jgi:hypothetical protein